MPRKRKCFRCGNQTLSGSLVVECETPAGGKKNDLKTVCADCRPHVKPTTCFKCNSPDIGVFPSRIPYTTKAGGKSWKSEYICEDCRQKTSTIGNAIFAGQPISSIYRARCFFCGSTEIKVHNVGIALGMGGEDYSFCGNCLKGMTADEFWEKFLGEDSY